MSITSVFITWWCWFHSWSIMAFASLSTHTKATHKVARCSVSSCDLYGLVCIINTQNTLTTHIPPHTTVASFQLTSLVAIMTKTTMKSLRGYVQHIVIICIPLKNLMTVLKCSLTSTYLYGALQGHVNCFYQGSVEGHPDWRVTISTCHGLQWVH